VPEAFQGRVTSVYMMGVVGGLAVGAVVGGALAGRWGVTAPFWFAFVGSAVLLAALWGQLVNIAHADADSLDAHADPVGDDEVVDVRDQPALDEVPSAMPDRRPDPTPAGK
jgi:predicted MFS family arabinose efflux permease